MFHVDERALKSRRHQSRHSSIESLIDVDLKKQKRLHAISWSLSYRAWFVLTFVVRENSWRWSILRFLISISIFDHFFLRWTVCRYWALYQRDQEIVWRRFCFFKSTSIRLSNELCLDLWRRLYSARESTWNIYVSNCPLRRHGIFQNLTRQKTS